MKDNNALSTLWFILFVFLGHTLRANPFSASLIRRVHFAAVKNLSPAHM